MAVQLALNGGTTPSAVWSCQVNYLIRPARTLHIPTVRQTLQSLLAVRPQAARLEERFFKQVSLLASAIPNAVKSPARGRVRRALRRTLKCPKCSRHFARPLHLGRHLSATYGRRKKKAAQAP